MILDWRPVIIVPGKNKVLTSLRAREALALKKLSEQGDQAVLEIGSAYGYSTIVMALSGASVTSVDPHLMGTREVFEANLKDFGVRDRVRMLGLPSHMALPTLVAEPLRFDLVFIDGDHSRDGVHYDWTQANHLVREGGWIACHDYGEDTCPGVKEALPEPDKLVDSLAVYAR